MSFPTGPPRGGSRGANTQGPGSLEGAWADDEVVLLIIITHKKGYHIMCAQGPGKYKGGPGSEDIINSMKNRKTATRKKGHQFLRLVRGP